MEAATAEREQEIAALQADLGTVRSELEHWRSTAAKYEEEIGRLQEAFAQQQQHQNTATQLQGEHDGCPPPAAAPPGTPPLTPLPLFQWSAWSCSSGVRICSRNVTA